MKLNTKQNNNKNQSLLLPSKVILTKPPHLRFTLTTLGKKKIKIKTLSFKYPIEARN